MKTNKLLFTEKTVRERDIDSSISLINSKELLTFPFISYSSSSRHVFTPIFLIQVLIFMSS